MGGLGLVFNKCGVLMFKFCIIKRVYCIGFRV